MKKIVFRARGITLKTKSYKIMQRIMIMAILMTGLFFFGAGQVRAQGDCNSLPELVDRRDCWVKKAKSGDKYLSEAILSGVNLSKVNLNEANLKRANLREMNLSGANLSGADLTSASLSGANLNGANLNDAFLKYAFLSEADLSGANLSGANFRNSDLSEAVVSRSTTKGVNFDDWKKRGGIVTD